ncbi:Mss4-like protein [Dipodascopsis tothii]|uniref:Mss4-like protein n=1 Tax=Dipodascopsis tothii TaxID=44089 RepID=UPI0034CF3E1B
MTTYTGSCDCGAIKVSAKIADPQGGVACHCGKCKSRYGVFCSVFVVPATDFAIEDRSSLTSWAYKGDSGSPVPCYFCKTCGVNIYREPAPLKPNVVLIAGVLDAWKEGKMGISASVCGDVAFPWVDVTTIKA